eukprot:361095-Chlamydomonas_euryale.AAC.2
MHCSSALHFGGGATHCSKAGTWHGRQPTSSTSSIVSLPHGTSKRPPMKWMRRRTSVFDASASPAAITSGTSSTSRGRVASSCTFPGVAAPVTVSTMRTHRWVPGHAARARTRLCNVVAGSRTSKARSSLCTCACRLDGCLHQQVGQVPTSADWTGAHISRLEGCPHQQVGWVPTSAYWIGAHIG